MTYQTVERAMEKTEKGIKIEDKTKKSKNSAAVKRFIRENAVLFWYIKPDAKEDISHEFLVETILNWGTRKDIKKMIKLLGMYEVAEIFYKNTSGIRTNYRKKIINFFNLYFEKFSHRNTYKKAGRTIAAYKGFF